MWTHDPNMLNPVRSPQNESRHELEENQIVIERVLLHFSSLKMLPKPTISLTRECADVIRIQIICHVSKQRQKLTDSLETSIEITCLKLNVDKTNCESAKSVHKEIPDTPADFTVQSGMIAPLEGESHQEIPAEDMERAVEDVVFEGEIHSEPQNQEPEGANELNLEILDRESSVTVVQGDSGDNIPDDVIDVTSEVSKPAACTQGHSTEYEKTDTQARETLRKPDEEVQPPPSVQLNVDLIGTLLAQLNSLLDAQRKKLEESMWTTSAKS
ncbi:hypothetical protein KSP40_PGU012141 [Platanthera guangdongensis]|uniref:Uncharacterized protein n=1 Tax=Platanthera guangdongensis TaxID=2320717 RepID=A0ABR2M462_9ASPA